jgi:hypothetical protein
LEKHENWLLRGVSPWVNPATWVLAVLTLWSVEGTILIGLWALGARVFARELPALLTRRSRRPGGGTSRMAWSSNFPGSLNQ